MVRVEGESEPWPKLPLLFILCSRPGPSQALSPFLTTTLKDRYYHPHWTPEEGSARLGAPSKAVRTTPRRQSQVEVQVCVVAKLLPRLPSSHHQGDPVRGPTGCRHDSHAYSLPLCTAQLIWQRQTFAGRADAEHMGGIAPTPKARFSFLGATAGVNQTHWHWLKWPCPTRGSRVLKSFCACHLESYLSSPEAPEVTPQNSSALFLAPKLSLMLPVLSFCNRMCFI